MLKRCEQTLKAPSVLHLDSSACTVWPGGLCNTRSPLFTPPRGCAFSLHLRCWAVWAGNRSHQCWRMSHGPAVIINDKVRASVNRYTMKANPLPHTQEIGMIKVLPGELTPSSVMRNKPFVLLQPLPFLQPCPTRRLQGAHLSSVHNDRAQNIVDVNLERSKKKYRKEKSSSLFWTRAARFRICEAAREQDRRKEKNKSVFLSELGSIISWVAVSTCLTHNMEAKVSINAHSVLSFALSQRRKQCNVFLKMLHFHHHKCQVRPRATRTLCLGCMWVEDGRWTTVKIYLRGLRSPCGKTV